MLKEKIDQVVQTMHIMRGFPYACTTSFTRGCTDRDIQVGLERVFGWIVPLGTIKAVRS